MTVGEQLFERILTTKKTQVLYLIKEEWLVDKKEVKYYHFILDYLRDNDALPEVKTVEDKYKILWPAQTGSAKFYKTELYNRFIYTSIAQGMPALMGDLKADPIETFNEMKTLLSSIGDNSTSKDTPYYKNAVKRFDNYKERITNSGITYISTGNDALDSVTTGYKRPDLITIAGRSGLGKSWFLIWLALLCEAALDPGMGPILFITNEMDEEEIAERMDCVRFKLHYDRFLKGKLTPAEQSRYMKGATLLHGSKASKINIVFNCSSLDELRGKILLYRPSIVFVDGSYLMEPDRDEGWERIAYITRNLKAICKDIRTPIINTTQMKRGTGKKSRSSLDGQDEFAFGMTYINDSDAAIRMYQDNDMQYHGTIGIEFAKGRRIPPGVKMEWAFDALKCTYDLEITDNGLMAATTPKLATTSSAVNW